MWFNAIKNFYDQNHPLYSDESIKTFVESGMITQEEYDTIVAK